jgi:hypothetical protein
LYWLYSNEILDIKALEYNKISLLLICGELWRIHKLFTLLWKQNSECLAKRWVNIWLFWFVWCFDGIQPPVEKDILLGFQWYSLF